MITTTRTAVTLRNWYNLYSLCKIPCRKLITEVALNKYPMKSPRKMAEQINNCNSEHTASNTAVWTDHTYTQKQQDVEEKILQSSSTVVNDCNTMLLQEHVTTISQFSPIPLKVMKLDDVPYMEIQDTCLSDNHWVNKSREDAMADNCSVADLTHKCDNQLEHESCTEHLVVSVNHFNELPFIANEEEIAFVNDISEQDIKKLNRRERRKLRRQILQTSIMGGSSVDSNSWAELPFATELKVPGEDEITSQKIKVKKRKKKKSTSTEDATEKIKRPNYFIAIHINSQEITQNVKLVQDNIVEKDKAFKKALISLATLHITLAVMHLDITDLKSAFDAMTTCNEKLSNSFADQPLNLPFQGLAHFQSGVLFAKIKEGEELNRLTDIANVVQESFRSNGIPVDDKDFQPHLTILKLSKLPWKIKKVIRKIQNELYKECKDTVFGYQTVHSLQLLSMTDPKEDNGYYHCLKEITF